MRSASEKFFSAGADVKRFLANDVDGQHGDDPPRARSARRHRLARPKLFVAYIAGHALGGGLEIALACDIRYAAEGTYRLGTAGGHARAAAGKRRHPAAPASDRRRPGARAAAHRATAHAGPGASGWGSSRSCSRGEDELRAHAEKLAALAPLALSEIKRAVYEGVERPLDDGLELERELIEKLFRSQDASEGLHAFVEKRPPEFVGRMTHGLDLPRLVHRR